MSEVRITKEVDGHVLLIGLNRPDKRNAFDADMIRQLGEAYTELSETDDLRVGLVFAHGPDFTTGLDLPSVAPLFAEGRAAELLEGLCDPWRMTDRQCGKPVIVAPHGRCFTAGIELILAADIAVASEDTVFAQMEVARGLAPLGGATFRMPARFGWGNAMRYLLTGDEFDAAKALRFGLVQELARAGEQLEQARELAGHLASRAPLAVQVALANARTATDGGRSTSVADLQQRVEALFKSEDIGEGITAMIERREPSFSGR